MRVLTFNSHQAYLHLLATSLPWDFGVVTPRTPAGSILSWSDKISIGKLNLLYHFVVVMAVLALVYLHFTTIIVLIAFVPMMVHAIVGTIRLSAQIRFRRLGYLLLAQSIAFAILLSLTMRT